MNRLFAFVISAAIAAAPVARSQVLQVQPKDSSLGHTDTRPIVTVESPPLGTYPLPAAGAANPSSPPHSALQGQIDTNLPPADTCKLRDNSVQGADGSKRIVLGCDN